jgi:RNA polymerase sigma factor (sigma-70 family)
MAAKDSHSNADCPIARDASTNGTRLSAARETSAAHESESTERRLTGVLEKYGRALKKAVARVCRGRLGLQRDEIEQEARIRLWRALTREVAVADIRPYLHRIVATAAIDAMRQLRSRREIPLDFANASDAWPYGPLPKAGGATPEGVVYGRELARAARRVVATLPINRRRAVRLHLQGFTTEEIGQLLRWSEPKARNLVYRGLADLRKKLRPELFPPHLRVASIRSSMLTFQSTSADSIVR